MKVTTNQIIHALHNPVPKPRVITTRMQVAKQMRNREQYLAYTRPERVARAKALCKGL